MKPMTWMTAFAACLSATAAAASAKEMSVETRFDRDVVRPVIDFSGVQEGLAEGPTQVLILGMRHLAQAPEEDFDLADLSLLLDWLAAWEPAIIATEDTAGRHCDVLERYADQYEGVAGRYCADITPAAESLGMARAEADSEANHPGEKVLVVVGSSHTAYFEAYLDALHDFEPVRLETVIAQ